MRSLIRVILLMFAVFTALMIAIRLTGLLTVDDIRYWLSVAQGLSPVYVVAVVALLLVIDLYIAVPTTTVVLLGGYFAGWSWGFLGGVVGLFGAGIMGFALSRHFGERVLQFIIRDAEQRQEMRETFHRHGVWMILLSRAMPMLPEVSACLAGATGMPLRRFLAAWSASVLPYCLVLAYAGSRSSLDNPLPAIIGLVGVSLILGLSWYAYKRWRPDHSMP